MAKDTIYFQMYTIKSMTQSVDKHHFVEATTPENGKTKVEKFYGENPEVTNVILRSSTKATQQDPKKYGSLIR